MSSLEKGIIGNKYIQNNLTLDTPRAFATASTSKPHPETLIAVPYPRARIANFVPSAFIVLTSLGLDLRALATVKPNPARPEIKVT